MTEFVRLAVFLATIALAIGVSLTRERRIERIAATVFISWILLVSLVAGLAQKDFWPFSPYTFLAEKVEGDPLVTKIELAVVNEDGSESVPGSDTWDPFSSFELGRVIETHWTSWNEEERLRVGRGLLDHAIRHHRRAASRWYRLLDAVDAPHPTRESAAARGDEPRALRIYELRWYPRARVERSAPIQRTLILEVEAR